MNWYKKAQVYGDINWDSISDELREVLYLIKQDIMREGRIDTVTSNRIKILNILFHFYLLFLEDFLYIFIIYKR